MSLAFWAAGATIASGFGEMAAALAFTVLVAFSGLLLFRKAPVTLDEAGVTCRTGFGVHRMVWDEIHRVETDGVTLVLMGASKQFPVTPRFWASESRMAAQAYLERELLRRNIPRVDNPVASRMVFRNTRVKTPHAFC